jgi:hypothetical protein
MRILPSSYRVRVVVLSVALASAGAYALACGDSGGGGGGASNGGDGGGGTLPEAGIGKSDADAPATTMRLAHVAADLGPVDFCYRAAKGTSFEGPVLGGGIGDPMRDGGADAGDEGGPPDDASADGSDAGASAVSYRSVSRYLTLDAAGPLTIALVAPGSTSCASPLFLADVTLDPGKLATVAIVGLTAPDAGVADRALVAFIDDRSTVADKARVRMVNAAFGSAAAPTSAPLAVRAASGLAITLAPRVEPRKAGTPTETVPIDALGYATVDALPSPAQLAVGAAADTGADASVDSWVSAAGELHLQGGSLHTGFILSGEDGKPFEVLWCTDTSTSGELTTCERVR